MLKALNNAGFNHLPSFSIAICGKQQNGVCTDSTKIGLR